MCGLYTPRVKGAIQTQSGAAVDAMRNGRKEVAEGIALAGEARTSLQRIVQETSGLVEMITQIAVAGEEQSSTSAQMAASVESISSATDQAAAGVSEIAMAARSMDTLMQELNGLIAGFKLDSATAPAREHANA